MERDELAQYLASLEREACYHVDEVLKESPFETTQRVRFIGENGSAGPPLIRKFIRCDAGIGSAYARIFEAQQNGQRFKHIPDILECYMHDEDLVVVMELVRGETLQEIVYQQGPSLDLARAVFPQLCDAVTELHEDFDPPIIHRDLKPSNIIISDAGLAIIDFGIAREFREGAATDTTHFGTRAFAPPEQFGFGQTTVRSDVYALGMVLYFCLTETIPDTGAMEAALSDKRIPAQMRALIAQVTALDPADRFASVRALKAAFLQAVSLCGAAEAKDVDLPSGEPQIEEAFHHLEGETRAVSPDHDAGGSSATTGTTLNQEPPAKTPTNEPTRETPITPASFVSMPENLTASPALVGKPPSAFEKYFTSDDRFTALGVIWNINVVAILVLALVACVLGFVNPDPETSYSPAFMFLSYLVFMPICIVATSWLLVDKRRLRRKFPALARFKTIHWVIVAAIGFGVMFFGIGISSLLFP